jgi:hypothetical protein
MAKLIDDIRAGAKLLYSARYMPDQVQWEGYRIGLKQHLEEHQPVPVLLIENVAKYAAIHYKLEEKISLPNVAPPYPAFWSEFRAAGIHQNPACRRVGVYAVAGERKDPSIKARWAINCHLFSEVAEGIYGPIGPLAVLVGEDGELLKGYPRPPLTERMDLVEVVMSDVVPTLVALNFLHCKNVTLEDHSMPPPLAKKYQARTGIRPVRYKTLVIEPLKQILKREGGIAEAGLIRALHNVRGHFAVYREEKPLFGKLHGQFFIPQHLRGVRQPDQQEKPPRTIDIKGV